MGFFSRLFGLDNKQAFTAADKAADEKQQNGISYDPALVPKLKNDHQQLLALFGKIAKTADSGQFDKLPAQLKQFKFSLQTHLVTENVRFYVYVQ